MREGHMRLKVLCVLYEDPVDGYPTRMPRDDIPRLDHYPDGQTAAHAQRPSTSRPGALLGSVSGELGLRPFLEAKGHTLVVTSDKDGPDSEFERELVDADVVISQPFWPAYLTAERIAKAPAQAGPHRGDRLGPRGSGRRHRSHGITVAEVTYSNSISVSEHVVMMILGLVRNYLPSHDWVVKGGWNIADCVERSYDLEGMAVGTVAAGRIGLAVLRRLKPFDVHLHYTDRHRLPQDGGAGARPHLPPRRGIHGARLRRGDHQCPAAPRDRAPVRRRHVRSDEARHLPGQHGPGQDLRPRRGGPRPGERAAGRVCRRRLVPTAPAH